jgi:hypothetical protein
MLKSSSTLIHSIWEFVCLRWLLLVLVFRDSPGWPLTGNLPASVSQVLRLQMCVTTPGQHLLKIDIQHPFNTHIKNK